MIDQEAYVASCAALVARKVTPFAAVPSVLALEDAIKTSEKQLEAQVRTWAGTSILAFPSPSF